MRVFESEILFMHLFLKKRKKRNDVPLCQALVPYQWAE